MADTFTIDFTISDESVNRYGYRILTEGIDISKFQLNPIALYMHDNMLLPVGMWQGVRKEDDTLKGTLKFDEKDEFALKLYHKYKDGFMNAVSLNVVPITESERPEHLLAGQKYATVTQCELLEVSPVTIPGNGNALRLCYADGKVYSLKFATTKQEQEQMAKESETMELADLRSRLDKSLQLNADALVDLHTMRGVVSDAEAVPMRKLALSNYADTKAMLESRIVVTPTHATDNDGVAMVKLHLDRGAVTAQERDFFERNAKLDFAGTKKILEARPGTESVRSFANSLSTDATPGDDRKSWTYLDYYKKDPDALSEMAIKDPNQYKTLEQSFISDGKKLGFKV